MNTILAQMVAEHMECSVENVSVFGADTDASPYDSGSYASSTTYVTGMAVEKALAQLKEKLCTIAADSSAASRGAGSRAAFDEARGTVSLQEIAVKSQCSDCRGSRRLPLCTLRPVSPPPFMVGMAEIELDRETGVVEVLNYAAVVDCGIPINPALRASRLKVASSRVSAIRSWKT